MQRLSDLRPPFSPLTFRWFPFILSKRYSQNYWKSKENLESIFSHKIEKEELPQDKKFMKNIENFWVLKKMKETKCILVTYLYLFIGIRYHAYYRGRRIPQGGTCSSQTSKVKSNFNIPKIMKFSQLNLHNFPYKCKKNFCQWKRRRKTVEKAGVGWSWIEKPAYWRQTDLLSFLTLMAWH